MDSDVVCNETPTAQIELPADPRAAGRARDFLHKQLCKPHHAAVEDTAELLVSELITNCIRYGTPPIGLAVECVGSDSMRVAVCDTNPDLPALRHADAADETGRGMELVDLLSDAWGVISDEQGGKSVWFCLH